MQLRSGANVEAVYQSRIHINGHPSPNGENAVDCLKRNNLFPQPELSAYVIDNCDPLCFFLGRNIVEILQRSAGVNMVMWEKIEAILNFRYQIKFPIYNCEFELGIFLKNSFKIKNLHDCGAVRLPCFGLRDNIENKIQMRDECFCCFRSGEIQWLFSVTCDHQMCKRCCVQWFNFHDTCPVCRCVSNLNDWISYMPAERDLYFLINSI